MLGQHFQMEIDILEISLDILAIWHVGVEFANFPGELRSKPYDDLRLAAADYFGFVVR